MKLKMSRPLLTAVLIVPTLATGSQGQSPLKVCPDPSAPCRSPHKTFAPYELPFQLPRTIRPNVDYKSASFYAVILKTLPLSDKDECDQGEYSSKIERERRQVQSLFPRRKVFAENLCPDMSTVSYITDDKSDAVAFIAVYGGTARSEAEHVQKALKQRYPSATIKRMQVVFQRIVQ